MDEQALLFAYIAWGTNVKFKCTWNFITYIYFKCNLIFSVKTFHELSLRYAAEQQRYLILCLI